MQMMGTPFQRAIARLEEPQGLRSVRGVLVTQ
jgi:hypothetical protein